METIYEMLPKRLRALQEARHLTRETAAEMCKIPVRSYTAFLYGQRFPRKTSLLRLCKGYGVGMDYFFASGGGVIHAEHSLKECAKRVSAFVQGLPDLMDAESDAVEWAKKVIALEDPQENEESK